MKKLILPFLLLCATLLSAQSTIPNAGFENWTTAEGCYPTNYATNPYAFDPQDLFSNASLITKATGYESLTGVELKIGGMIEALIFRVNPIPPEMSPIFPTYMVEYPMIKNPQG